MADDIIDIADNPETDVASVSPREPQSAATCRLSHSYCWRGTFGHNGCGDTFGRRFPANAQEMTVSGKQLLVGVGTE